MLSIVVQENLFFQQKLAEVKDFSMLLVGPAEMYKVLDREQVLGPKGSDVEVIVSEVFNPDKFYIMKKGKDNSIKLNADMDSML